MSIHPPPRMSYTPRIDTSLARLLLLYIDVDVSPRHPPTLLVRLKLLIQLHHHGRVRQVKIIERPLGRLVRPPRIGPLGEIVPVGGMNHGRELCAIFYEHDRPSW